jgi:hypothetical protein
MKRLTNNIKIGDHEFNFVTEFEAESTYESFTDTCTITLPTKIQFQGKPIAEGVNSVFKIGDKVKVMLGYDFNNQTVFQGYVTMIGTQTPLQIHCQDAMYLFKNVSYHKSFKSVTLKELVNYLMSKISEPLKVNVTMDASLGKFMIDSSTGTAVFEELKKTYGISSFIRDNELFVGLSFNSNNTESYRKEKEFVFQKQIIEDDLEYKSEADRKIKVHASSIDSNNKKIEYTTGDSEGDKVDVFAFNLSSSDLKKFADEQLERQKYNGFEGDFLTFGNPLVRHGDVAKLVDLKYPERDGKYIVKKVVTTFGSGGYRQRISLGKKLS